MKKHHVHLLIGVGLLGLGAYLLTGGRVFSPFSNATGCGCEEPKPDCNCGGHGEEPKEATINGDPTAGYEALKDQGLVTSYDTEWNRVMETSAQKWDV